MVKPDTDMIFTQSTLDERARSLAQHLVALDGGWGEVRQRIGTKRTHELLEQTLLRTEQEIKDSPGGIVYDNNSFPGYGISRESLTSLRGTGQGSFDMNYNLLRMIWNGINYVETLDSKGEGIPHEMLASMNTNEILSLYRGFGKLIRDGYVESGTTKISREELKSMGVYKAVSKIVGYGYRHKSMQDIREKGYSAFPTKSGNLMQRINRQSEQVKEKFAKLLDNPIKHSQITVSGGGFYDFHDPNYNGDREPIKGLKGREAYIMAISGFMGKLYERNAQKA